MTSSQQETALTKSFGQQAFSTLQSLWNQQYSSGASIDEVPVNNTPQTTTELLTTTPDTILYLAYGSNLCFETFSGKRGIKPLSAANVHVPCLDLTFDLAGIPYIEPCFANTQYRDPSKPSSNDYHKDRWKKGLIGVVYEVTPEDYRTIIATEGGGASYQDVVVDCFIVAKGAATVDAHPTDVAIKAHTLLCPRTSTTPSLSSRIMRPDPSYAQPSARYLKLITDGAEEHSLPSEYLAYLHNIRPYTITTYRQRVGQVLYVVFWIPVLMVLFGLGKVFSGDDGKIPEWLSGIMGVFFRMMWLAYDGVLKKAFGDGERTIKAKDEDEEKGCAGRRWCEKRVRFDEKTNGI